MSLPQEKETNFIDSLTSRKEVALGLSAFVIGGLATITLADFGAVAVGLRESVSLPSEITVFTVTVGTTLLGYILGKSKSD